MIEKTEAIVLHSRKYKDTSVLLSLFTREHGKVRVVAKGARRIKGGYGASAMPLSVVEATYSLRDGRDLHTLRTAETIKVLRNITRQYEHVTTALAIVELVELSQPLQEKNERLFQLLFDTLVALESSNDNCYSFFAAFSVRCAEEMGFRMTLPGTEEIDVKREYVFSFEDGSIVHLPVNPGNRVWRLPGRTLKKLCGIAHAEMQDVSVLYLEDRERREIQDFFVRYYSFHLDKSVVFRTEDMMLGIQRS